MSFGISAATWAAVSVGIAAYAASQQADAQKKASDYAAQVEANNAKIALNQRSLTLQQGQEDAQQSMMERSQMLSKQRAALASNGLDLNSGSATDLFATTEFLGEQDVNAITSNAARSAWGYQVDSGNSTAQSNLSQWKSDSINPTSIAAMAGGQSLLSSASSYAMGSAGSGAGAKTKSTATMKMRAGSW